MIAAPTVDSTCVTIIAALRQRKVANRANSRRVAASYVTVKAYMGAKKRSSRMFKV